MKLFCIKVTLVFYFVISIHCFYLNPDDNIHTWINNVQKVNKSWMIYMTSALYHCLLKVTTKIPPLQKFTIGVELCIVKFTRLATDCTFKINYEVAFSKLEYLKCPLPPRHQLEDGFINNKYIQVIINKEWNNLTLILLHLKKPLKQECITTHYLQHGEKSLYLNHRLLQSSGKFDRLNYIFEMKDLFGLNITFMRFLLSEMCFVSHPYLPGYLEKYFHDCLYNEGTEYIKLNKNKDTGADDLFFCMKRPSLPVFTTSSTNMEYSLCKLCMNYKSIIIFNYQLISKGSMVTINDSYETIFYDTKVHDMTCIVFRKFCVRSLHLFFVKTEKYKGIKLMNFFPKTRLFYISDTNFNMINLEIIGTRKWVVVDYFHIALLVSSDPAEERFKPAYNFMESPSEVAHITQLLKKNSFISSLFCVKNNTCRKIYKLQSHSDGYIQVNITNLLYTGWKVPHCLYGGISFWEWKPIEHYYSRIGETLALCDNYVNIEHLSGKSRKVKWTGHLKSEYFEKNSANYIMPYTSTRNEVVFVLYHNSVGFLNISFTISSLQCKGILLSHCTLRQYHILKFGGIDQDNFCIIYQLGLSYLPITSFKQDDLVFETNLNLILGCFRLFQFGLEQNGVCYVQMNFTYLIQEKHYFTYPHREISDTNNFNFNHEISSSKQYGCKDTPENIVHRAQRKFVLVTNRSKYDISIHRFAVSVNFLDPIVSLDQDRQEDLNMTVEPHSQSFVLLTLRQSKCKISTGDRLPTGISRLHQQDICLRDPVQKPLNSTMVVELSLQGQFKMPKCLLGQIEIKSYLCLSDNYYTESMPIQEYRYAPYCVSSQSNLGEDILLWTLNLTNELVYNSGGHVRIFLPGKMFETMFHTLENDCCLTSSCYLKYRWNFTYWASSHISKRNKKSKRLTWFTARQYCKKLGQDLYSFVSYEDVKHFIAYLVLYHDVSLVTSIFVGLHREPKGTWKWSDRRPVGMTLWGPPFSPPLPTGRSCYTENSSSRTNTKCFRNRPDQILNMSESCAVMSFTNLVYPQWYPVHCNSPIEAHLICMKPYEETKYKPHLPPISNFNSYASRTFCGYGKILFKSECFSFTRNVSRLALRNRDYWKLVKACPYIKRDCYMDIEVVMKYLSQISYLKPVFAFPASHEAQEFYSWCHMPDVDYNKLYFIYISQCTIHECTSETNHGIRRPEMRNYRRFPSNTEAFLHCFINGRKYSLTKKETFRRIDKRNIFFGISDNKTHYYQYDDMLQQFVLKKEGVDSSDTFYIIREKLKDTKLNELASLHKVYLCSSKEFVSQLHQHDGEEDCESGDDETGHLACYYDDHIRNDSFCKTACRRPRCACADLYYQKAQGGCSPFNSNIKNNLVNIKLKFFDNVTKIYQTNINSVDTKSIVIEAFRNDNNNTFGKYLHYLQSDCSEEELTNADFKYFKNICHGPDEIPCTYGCRRCFPTYKLCVFELDHQGNLLYCPSGAHLKNCKEMECNNMFKCKNHYCIPFRHVCDGTWHCLFGDDEHSCTHFHCGGFFVCAKCHHKECIHVTEICNGVEDCCTGEDEDICNLQCPKPCKCMMYAAACSSSSFESISMLMNSYRAYLELTNILMIDNSFDKVYVERYILVLKWTKSNLQDICTHLKLNSAFLQYLDFLNFQIENHCFLLHKELKILLLANNVLRNIEINAFHNIFNLIKLDLSNNNLLEFSANIILKMNIFMINISHNNFKILDTNIENLEGSMISTNDYRICCLMQESDMICSRKPTWPQSCNLMLNSRAVEVFCLIFSIVIIMFNLIAFTFGIFKHSKSKLKSKMQIQSAFRLNTLCLHFNDLLFGIYLLVIFSAGRYYNKYFVIHADQWLSSVLCKSCGLITSIALLNSLFLLTLISMSRFVAVKYPFSSHFKNIQFLIRYLLAGFLSNISFCVGIFLLYNALEAKHEMPSSTCLFLGETLNSKTIKCFTILVALLQFCSCILIIILYSHIIKLYSASEIRGSQGKVEKQVLLQALLITVTNAMSWLPSGIIYIITVTVETYPISLLIWNAVLINPINSLINPIIFYIIPLVKQFEKIKSL